MYDNTCKFIAETFPTAIASWLLGQPLSLTKLEPSELSVEPIRADSLIFLKSDQIILHVEFQTSPEPNLPFRMADYQLRLYRRYPYLSLRQIIVYLRPSQSPLVYQDCFTIPNLTATFEIIRLWEQATEQFFRSPGLFPFAVLGNTNNPQMTLQQVAQEIEQIEAVTEQRNIAASTAILAGLKLEKEMVKSILRSDIMRESVIYQEIEEEARKKGLEQGLEQGLQQGTQQGSRDEALAFVFRLLKRRLGTVNPQLESQVKALSVQKLEELGEALLDLNSETEVTLWLDNSLSES